jgi:hypothetical protein
MEKVETILTTPDSGKESTLLIPYAKHTSSDQHACVTLVELTNADDRVLQAWDVVDAAESLVFTILASEDDGADALDFDDRAVAEFDGAGDCSVNFSEGVTMSRHVICGTGIKVPTLDSLVVAARPEVGLCLRLVNVKRACSVAMLCCTTMAAAGAMLCCTTVAATGATLQKRLYSCSLSPLMNS